MDLSRRFGVCATGSLLLAALVFAACGGPQQPKGNGDHTTSGLPDSWLQCEADTDCDTAVHKCCACDSGDYRAVNKSQVHEARARLAPKSCDDCPQQDCPKLFLHCRSGRCEVDDQP